MNFPFLKKSRRRRLLAEPAPDAWLEYVRRNVFLYRLLSAAEQAKLLDAVKVFVAEKSWAGRGGLAITDEIKVTIAAQACLLTLGFEGYYFDEVKSILVYPGGVLIPDPEEGADPLVANASGVAPPKGPVLLSWWEALWEGRRLAGSNVVLHEFAHKLAELNSPATGTPPMADLDLWGRWEEVFAREFKRLCADARYDRPTLLDSYGASDRNEFFAVATECFFTQPLALRRRHPPLYEVLAGWYRQDPAGRRTPDEEDASRAREAEDEYARHVLAECDEVIRRHPAYADAYSRRAEWYHDLGEYDRALADYGTVIRLAPTDPNAYCDRGEVYLDQGSYDRAVADFTEAIRLCPGFRAPLYWRRGAAYARQGERRRALADLNRAIRADPKDDRPYLERGLVHCDGGDYGHAVRDFTTAIRLYPGSADAYSNRALAYLGNREYDKASADCTRALELDPDIPEPYKHRGVAHYHQGDYGRAIADCTEAIRLDPHYAEAYRARALAYAARGEEEEARRDQAQAEALESGAAGPDPGQALVGGPRGE
jgi:Mlc titration factor MtfA (ptsG expression regulator)/Tfp pilus assembly protein PilF